MDLVECVPRTMSLNPTLVDCFSALSTWMLSLGVGQSLKAHWHIRNKAYIVVPSIAINYEHVTGELY